MKLINFNKELQIGDKVKVLSKRVLNKRDIDIPASPLRDESDHGNKIAIVKVVKDYFVDIEFSDGVKMIADKKGVELI